MSILSKIIADAIGFNPSSNEEEVKKAFNGSFALSDIRLVFNPSEEIQLMAVRWFPSAIKYIRNPTLNVQLEAIRLSKYDLNVIMYCPDYEKFEQEILNNLIIKDIIQ